MEASASSMVRFVESITTASAAAAKGDAARVRSRWSRSANICNHSLRPSVEATVPFCCHATFGAERAASASRKIFTSASGISPFQCRGLPSPLRRYPPMARCRATMICRTAG